MPYTSPRETLAAASRPNSKTIAAHVVLAHPRAVFHPCTCGLRESTAAAATALIGCDDVEVATGTTKIGEDDRDRLLPLHRRATTLNRYSNSSLLPLLSTSSGNNP
jgi:hypothetical protein